MNKERSSKSSSSGSKTTKSPAASPAEQTKKQEPKPAEADKLNCAPPSAVNGGVAQQQQIQQEQGDREKQRFNSPEVAALMDSLSIQDPPQAVSPSAPQ